MRYTFYFADFIFIVRLSSAKIGSLENFRLYGILYRYLYGYYCSLKIRIHKLFKIIEASRRKPYTTVIITTIQLLYLYQAESAKPSVCHKSTIKSGRTTLLSIYYLHGDYCVRVHWKLMFAYINEIALNVLVMCEVLTYLPAGPLRLHKKVFLATTFDPYVFSKIRTLAVVTIADWRKQT